jgi:hypothetical protein
MHSAGCACARARWSVVVFFLVFWFTFFVSCFMRARSFSSIVRMAVQLPHESQPTVLLPLWRERASYLSLRNTVEALCARRVDALDLAATTADAAPRRVGKQEDFKDVWDFFLHSCVFDVVVRPVFSVGVVAAEARVDDCR